ncbi:MAG: hypothetical protein ACKO0Z_24470, partial [Betaproteobacteria bacterium]
MSTTGIDFVIQGKDAAKPALSAVEAGLSRLETKIDGVAAATDRLTKVTGAIAAAYGLVKLGLEALGGLGTINQAYDDAATAVSELNTAIRLQGKDVEAYGPKLQAFADEIQHLTGINDDATLGWMRQAALLGTAAEDLDDITKAAIGLAEATGTEASSAIRQLQSAQNGHFDSLMRVIPALRTMKTDEEKLTAVMEMASRGLEAKLVWSNKVAESGVHASTAIDKLTETVGAIIAPFR